jgi:hypothetical protein
VAWTRLEGRRAFRQDRGKGRLPEDTALRKAACSRRSEGLGLKKAGLIQLRKAACWKACRTASGRRAAVRLCCCCWKITGFAAHCALLSRFPLPEELKRQYSIHSSYTNSLAIQQCMLTVNTLGKCWQHIDVALGCPDKVLTLTGHNLCNVFLPPAKWYVPVYLQPHSIHHRPIPWQAIKTQQRTNILHHIMPKHSKVLYSM